MRAEEFRTAVFDVLGVGAIPSQEALDTIRDLVHDRQPVWQPDDDRPVKLDLGGDQLQVSDDGINWHPIGAGTPTMPLRVGKLAMRYIRRAP